LKEDSQCECSTEGRERESTDTHKLVNEDWQNATTNKRNFFSSLSTKMKEEQKRRDKSAQFFLMGDELIEH
jgi:hypothetical protein